MQLDLSDELLVSFWDLETKMSFFRIPHGAGVYYTGSLGILGLTFVGRYQLFGMGLFGTFWVPPLAVFYFICLNRFQNTEKQYLYQTQLVSHCAVPFPYCENRRVIDSVLYLGRSGGSSVIDMLKTGITFGWASTLTPSPPLSPTPLLQPDWVGTE